MLPQDSTKYSSHTTTYGKRKKKKNKTKSSLQEVHALRSRSQHSSPFLFTQETNGCPNRKRYFQNQNFLRRIFNIVYIMLQSLSFFSFFLTRLNCPRGPIPKSFLVIEHFPSFLYLVTNHRSLRTICLTFLVIDREYLIKAGCSFPDTVSWKLVRHDLAVLHGCLWRDSEFWWGSIKWKFNRSLNEEWISFSYWKEFDLYIEKFCLYYINKKSLNNQNLFKYLFIKNYYIFIILQYLF